MIKDKLDEKTHRLEFIEEYKITPNKFKFLVDHPSVFSSAATVFTPQKFPDVFLPNGTNTQVQTSASSSATSNITRNLVVPYIFTVTTDINTNPIGVGVANSTINLVNGGIFVFNGASYGQDCFNLVDNVGGAGSPTNIYENQNSVATQTAVSVGATPAGPLYWTFREYTPGNLQWIITNSLGAPIGSYPSSYSTVVNPWTSPSTTSRCIVIITYNITVTFSTVATPANLI